MKRFTLTLILFLFALAGIAQPALISDDITAKYRLKIPFGISLPNGCKEGHLFNLTATADSGLYVCRPWGWLKVGSSSVLNGQGISKVLAGFGLAVVNDSTLRVDTIAIVSKTGYNAHRDSVSTALTNKATIGGDNVEASMILGNNVGNLVFKSNGSGIATLSKLGNVTTLSLLSQNANFVSTVYASRFGRTASYALRFKENSGDFDPSDYMSHVIGGATRLYVNPNTVTIGSNTSINNASLNLDETNKYFLPNRLTTVQRDLLVSPVQGAFIYNGTEGVYQMYSGGVWKSLALATAVAGDYWPLTGTASGQYIKGDYLVDDFIRFLDKDADSEFVIEQHNVLVRNKSLKVENSNSDFVEFDVDGNFRLETQQTYNINSDEILFKSKNLPNSSSFNVYDISNVNFNIGGYGNAQSNFNMSNLYNNWSNYLKLDSGKSVESYINLSHDQLDISSRNEKRQSILSMQGHGYNPEIDVDTLQLSLLRFDDAERGLKINDNGVFLVNRKYLPINIDYNTLLRLDTNRIVIKSEKGLVGNPINFNKLSDSSYVQKAHILQSVSPMTITASSSFSVLTEMKQKTVFLFTDAVPSSGTYVLEIPDYADTGTELIVINKAIMSPRSLQIGTSSAIEIFRKDLGPVTGIVLSQFKSIHLIFDGETWSEI